MSYLLVIPLLFSISLANNYYYTAIRLTIDMVAIRSEVSNNITTQYKGMIHNNNGNSGNVKIYIDSSISQQKIDDIGSVIASYNAIPLGQ